jgi:hypothetical protein
MSVERRSIPAPPFIFCQQEELTKYVEEKKRIKICKQQHAKGVKNKRRKWGAADTKEIQRLTWCQKTQSSKGRLAF